jgi:hypothetical protein
VSIESMGGKTAYIRVARDAGCTSNLQAPGCLTDVLDPEEI